MCPGKPRVQLDRVEFWVQDRDRVRETLARFGFTRDEAALQGPPHEVTLISAGHVRLAVCQGATEASPIVRHVAKHGDGVGDVALVCEDLPQIAKLAAGCGLDTRIEDDAVRIDLLGDGTIIHTVRHRHGHPLPASAQNGGGSHFEGIDHVTYCLPYGTIESVAQCYRDVFGLAEVPNDDCSDVGGQVDGMRSVVLRSPLGFTIVLTSPASAANSGQIQHFLTTHRGAGVQHIAIACADLPGTVHLLRSSGVRFLDVPAEHLEASHQRLHGRTLAWDALRREQVLVDEDDDGLLFQLFTYPLVEGSGFFFEFIQRAGATGFGAANVRALFAAVDASLREPRVEG